MQICFTAKYGSSEILRNYTVSYDIIRHLFLYKAGDDMKGKRRDNGAGTIVIRPDGRYMAQISLMVNGKRKRPTVYGRTKREVMEKMNILKNQKQNGTYIDPSRLTVTQWIERWLEDYVKINLEQKSYEKMESLTRIHIIPGIGRTLIRKLTASHIQALYRDKINPKDDSRGLAASSVRQLHAVLHSAMDQAVKEGIIGRNVAEATRPPQQKVKEQKAWTREQVKTFLTAAESHKYYAAFVVVFGTGLRCGELLGMRWQDIDFKNRILTVCQSAVVTAKQGIVLKAPKTRKGTRTVILPDEAITALRCYKVEQAKTRLQWGEAYQKGYDLVFSSDDGSPMNQRSITYVFQQLIKKSGLPAIRFHDIRHTHATLLLQAGENVQVVSDRLGHENISTTLKTYAHIMPGMQEQAADKINDILAK